MAAIDLIVLGMLKQRPMSAYELQKLVEYRRISQWVKISTPSIYKKVISLEEKGLIVGRVERDGRMPEKAVYSLTEAGERAFASLMRELSGAPIRMFLDFNAVIVNLHALPPDEQAACLSAIRAQVAALRASLEDNLSAKSSAPDVPWTGLAVLRQQHALAEAIEAWMASLPDAQA